MTRGRTAADADHLHRSGGDAPGWCSQGREAVAMTASAECFDAGSCPIDGPVRVGADHYRSTVTIVNEMGLHARPASLFVELANRFDCDVALSKGRTRVDGKSILQLLSLSAEAGTKLVLETRGPEALAALAALGRLVASGFEESLPPSSSNAKT
jgi:phosphotransferase system HPr (HPr) family protein